MSPVRFLRRRLTAAKADTCDMPVGYGKTCQQPGDHLGGCDRPTRNGERQDGAR